MKPLKIVFMGTPEFAVASLKMLIDQSYDVVGVITAPDKPAGRGRKLHQSAVKEYAINNKLTVLQPTNLKDEQFLKQLKALNANLQIVVAFRMLPKVVWQMPQIGTFNLHASLLPNYRGAAPINWAIINGESKTGVSTFFIDEKIDTGEMILQKEVPISATETAGSLHDTLMMTGSELILDTVRLIEQDKVQTTPQPEIEGIKTAYKIHKETCKLNWEEHLDTIYNKIRGLSPYPGAWTTLFNKDEELTLKIYQVNKIIEDHKFKNGTIITDKATAKVAVKGGFIDLVEIQLPAKRKMEISALLNGYEFLSDAKVL
jgi:methionyl-tRNA formyltransferase